MIIHAENRLHLNAREEDIEEVDTFTYLEVLYRREVELKKT